MENDFDSLQSSSSSTLKWANVIFKNKRIAFTAFIFVTLIAIAIALLSDPIYEARSTVLVKMGREYLAQPELGDKIAPTMSIHQEGIISSEIQILSSKELKEKVINNMKVANLYPDLVADSGQNVNLNDVAAARMEKGLTLNKVKNSNVIEITFQHKDPRVAAEVVNLLVDLFREKHLQVFREPQSNFLVQQLEKYTEKLSSSQDALEDFKKQNDVFSLEEQRSLLLRQKMEMDAALKLGNNGIQELHRKVTTLKSQLSKVYKSENTYALPEDTNIQDAKTKLLSLLLEEQQLLRKYSPTNKLVVNSKNEIQIVRNFINVLENEAKTKSRTGNPIYLDLYRELLLSEASLNSLVAKTTSIRSQLRETENSLRYVNQSEQKLENLKREKTVNEKNYQVYLDRVEESRMLDEMNRQKLANISVIQAATVPVNPASKSRSKIVLVGAMCGVFMALGLAFLVERANQTFSTPEKVEKVLGVPVLVSIPYH